VPITFKCPHCQATLQTVSNMGGKQETCPNCNKEVSVPRQEEGTQSQKKE